MQMNRTNLVIWIFVGQFTVPPLCSSLVQTVILNPTTETGQPVWHILINVLMKTSFLGNFSQTYPNVLLVFSSFEIGKRKHNSHFKNWFLSTIIISDLFIIIFHFEIVHRISKQKQVFKNPNQS